jgi:HAD superfamily hydrolase (TIGR01509 family)
MRALIFDYDGLIIDTESPEYESWRRIWADHGQELKPEHWVHVIGGPIAADFAAQLEERLGRTLDWGPLLQARAKHHQELMAGQGLLPGVEALMRRAREKGWGVGVASSSSSSWVEGGLERLGLARHVQTVRTRDRVKNLKPHPEPYLAALADLGAEAGHSFGFEDSQTGVKSAKAARLTVVAVPNALTRLHDLSEADMILESLELFSLPEHDG